MDIPVPVGNCSLRGFPEDKVLQSENGTKCAETAANAKDLWPQNRPETGLHHDRKMLKHRDFPVR